MANQYYQFAFNFGSPTLVTTFQTQGASSWSAYQEPNFTRGVIRSGGPNSNNPNGPAGNYLVASSGDSIYINVQGPTGWALVPNSVLNVIVSQANSPGQGQGLTPFANGYTFYPLPMAGGTLLPDGVTRQFSIPSPIQSSANPGQGNFNRYEITVAFSANDANGNTYYFSDDPEMDVQGSGSIES